MEIGKTIRRIRKKRGIRQVDFSKEVGISQTYLSQIENDDRNPTVSVLERIGNYLEVPYAVFVFMSLSEDDIPKSKIESYLIARPILEGLIEKIFI